VTVGLNITTLTLLLTLSLPPVVRAMMSIPNIAIENAMACRVFRQLKLGLMHEHPALTSTRTTRTTVTSQQPTLNRIRFNDSIWEHSRSLDGVELQTVIPSFQSTGPRSQASVKSKKVAVNVMQEVEVNYDRALFRAEKATGHHIV
jgi:hypothetical protein